MYRMSITEWECQRPEIVTVDFEAEENIGIYIKKKKKPTRRVYMCSMSMDRVIQVAWFHQNTVLHL